MTRERTLAMAASLLGLILAAVCGYVWGMSSALALLAVLASLAVGFTARRAQARMLKRLADIQARQRQDRSDASRWEQKIVRAVLDGSTAGTGSPVLLDLEASAALLVQSGVFQRSFHEARSRRRFFDDLSAARDYIEHGMPIALSPHPLINPSRLPEHVRNNLRARDVAGFLGWLRGPRANQPSLSDFFTPSAVEAPFEVTNQHPGGSLGWFLEHATERTLLPSTEIHARWADVSRAWDDTFSAHRASWRVLEPRSRDWWDSEAEQHVIVESRSTHQPSTAHVTVVMPVRNGAAVVARAIASVRSQSHSNWTLVVVDDGSTDETQSVVRTEGNGDTRIRLMSSSGKGASAARNVGLRAAADGYVAFLDADNAWTPHFLTTMLTAMEANGWAAAHSGMRVTTGQTVLYRAFDGDREDLKAYNHIDLNTLVLSTEVARLTGDFDEGLRRWIDHDYVLRVARHATPHLVEFIGCEYDNNERPERITSTQSDEWERVVLDKAWCDWDLPPVPVVERRVTVVIPVKDQPELTLASIRSVLTTTRLLDVEIHVVDNGSSLATRLYLSGAFASEPRVRFFWVHRNLNFATGSNIGLTKATGAIVVFLNNDTVARPGWLEPLVAAMDEPGVLGAQALLAYPDDSIQTAGTVWVRPDSLPVHLLVGAPLEDGAKVTGQRFSAISAAAAAFRTEQVRELRGFDPRFRNGMEDVDLCLRLAQTHGGTYRVVPASVVEHHESRTPGRKQFAMENRRLFLERWRGSMPEVDTAIFEGVDLTLVSVEDDSLPEPSPVPTFVRSTGLRPRRWGIWIPAPGGSAGDRWGDTAFAHSLAAALRRLGQEVVTYRHGADRRVARERDDVALVLRGRDACTPIDGLINIAWIISHPESVSDEELRSMDIVFAASVPWAASNARRLGRDISPLLQCTDADLFRPDGPRGTQRPTTFVGSVHPGRTRAMVLDAVTAGVDLRVIGSGWVGTLPHGVLESDHVDNRDLAKLYRSASCVLADHWPAMAEAGFIQNRVFDALACGVPVLSDPVLGLHEQFSGLVPQCGGPADIARYVHDPLAHPAHDLNTRIALAEKVRIEHSFDARAVTLVTSVEGWESRAH